MESNQIPSIITAIDPQYHCSWHPLGCPSLPVEQLLQPIFRFLGLVKMLTLLLKKVHKIIKRKDSFFNAMKRKSSLSALSFT